MREPFAVVNVADISSDLANSPKTNMIFFGRSSHSLNRARRKLSGISKSAVPFRLTIVYCEPCSVSSMAVMLYGMILNSLVLVFDVDGLSTAFVSFGRNSLYLALSFGKLLVLRIHSANKLSLN